MSIFARAKSAKSKATARIVPAVRPGRPEKSPGRPNRKKHSHYRKMTYRLLIYIGLCLLGYTTARAQDDSPTANPEMTYIDADGSVVNDTQYDGSAPLAVTFTANPEHVGSYTPLYEWRFTKMGESSPFLVRNDENTEYTFRESGSFTVELLISFVQGRDTVEYKMDEAFTLTFSESKLEVPNAFTPNGDGINDVFQVKEGYKSIVSFKAQVFSRWGKKLYEWNTPEGGWDGKSGGKDVPDGAYYLNLQARGADGRKYNIKKVINLLRGYSENSGPAQ